MKLGLIGYPLSHSFSPILFAELFKKFNISGSYQLFELESLSDLKHLVHSQKLSGFNVTIPHKIKVISMLDIISEEAKAIGSVNTVCIKNNIWHGFNTDFFGFEKQLQLILAKNNGIKKAIVLGTGGSSKAVQAVLYKWNIEVILISQKPTETAKDYEFLLHADLSTFQLVVQTTPVGMFPDINNCISFPFHKLNTTHICIDLIYNPSKTLFLQKSAEFGAAIYNGALMLEQQALKAFEFFQEYVQ